jgi:hypothetical protein
MLMKMLEDKDAEKIVQGKTEIKPGRPTASSTATPTTK